MYPEELRYAATHEWIRLGDLPTGDDVTDDPVTGDPLTNVVTIGITTFAQDALGDVVYVDLPALGTRLSAGSSCGSIESVKTVSDVYAPLSGEVLEVNGLLAERPELVNSDPFGAGWLIRLQLADEAELDGLLDAAAYTAETGEG